MNRQFNIRHRPLLLKEIDKYATVHTGYKFGYLREKYNIKTAAQKKEGPPMCRCFYVVLLLYKRFIDKSNLLLVMQYLK